MSRKDAIVLAARTLAVLLTVWALADLSYLPDRLYSFVYYLNHPLASSASTQYERHYNLIALGFLVVRIVGYSLMARWLYKSGPEVEELLLPAVLREKGV